MKLDQRSLHHRKVSGGAFYMGAATIRVPGTAPPLSLPISECQRGPRSVSPTLQVPQSQQELV